MLAFVLAVAVTLDVGAISHRRQATTWRPAPWIFGIST